MYDHCHIIARQGQINQNLETNYTKGNLKISPLSEIIIM